MDRCKNGSQTTPTIAKPFPRNTLRYFFPRMNSSGALCPNAGGNPHKPTINTSSGTIARYSLVLKCCRLFGSYDPSGCGHQSPSLDAPCRQKFTVGRRSRRSAEVACSQCLMARLCCFLAASLCGAVEATSAGVATRTVGQMPWEHLKWLALRVGFDGNAVH